MKQKAEREEARERQMLAEKAAKEMEIARLRAQQERSLDYRAQLDEMNALRMQEEVSSFTTNIFKYLTTYLMNFQQCKMSFAHKKAINKFCFFISFTRVSTQHCLFFPSCSVYRSSSVHDICLLCVVSFVCVFIQHSSSHHVPSIILLPPFVRYDLSYYCPLLSAKVTKPDLFILERKRVERKRKGRCHEEKAINRRPEGIESSTDRRY